MTELGARAIELAWFLMISRTGDWLLIEGMKEIPRGLSASIFWYVIDLTGFPFEDPICTEGDTSLG